MKHREKNMQTGYREITGDRAREGERHDQQEVAARNKTQRPNQGSGNIN